MQYPHLFHHSIFVIPAEESAEHKTATPYLLYAPLTGYLMMSDQECLNRLEYAAEHSEGDEKLLAQLDKMCNISLYGKDMYSIRNPNEYLRLSILPNDICNFTCSYCFSAKDRSQKELSKEHLMATLTYFIDAKRIREKKLFITFLGGGEPMVSWKLLKFGIEYASMLAKAQGISLILEIVSNGSILTEEMLQMFIAHQVRLRISFEVLKDVQNMQRGQYDKVCKTIDRLSSAGLYIELRAMITPLNLERMTEMVQELIDRFPEISYYMFDPVTDKRTFYNMAETDLFYRKYQQHFFSAMELAQQYGKQLKCAPLRNLNSIVERYCCGELCLTPDGTFTICHRVSSPLDILYEKCVYGKVNGAGRIEFNHGKYRHLIHSDTVYDNPDCETCFVKWNCGGGCMMQNQEYDKNIRDIICKFTRSFSKELLLRRLNTNTIENIPNNKKQE
jgi:radical SAM protein with 4Fe4S-binding SPASM domain